MCTCLRSSPLNGHKILNFQGSLRTHRTIRCKWPEKLERVKRRKNITQWKQRWIQFANLWLDQMENNRNDLALSRKILSGRLTDSGGQSITDIAEFSRDLDLRSSVLW